MTSIYQGDPLLSSSGSGLTITVLGGQPKMDNGLINAVLLTLFHDPWFMNAVIEDELQHIGSEFTSYLASNPITVSNLSTARSIAFKSLQWLLADQVASEIDVRLRNPNGTVVQVLVLIKPPGKTAIVILASKYGLNWKIQLDGTTKL